MVMLAQRILKSTSGLTITHSLLLPLGLRKMTTESTEEMPPPVFCTQGELAHWSGSLIPELGCPPVYAQLYIYEPHTTVTHHMSNNADSGLQQDTMELLEEVICTHHQYPPVYLYSHQVLVQYPEALDVSICLHIAPGTDQHLYNLTTADEAAVILPTNITTTSTTEVHYSALAIATLHMHLYY